MYYLERRQNKKFHDWARRVYNQQCSIINKLPENCDIEYPLTKKIITNTKFPRSIIAVKKYVNYIKEYELLKELRPNNIHECSYCGGGSGMDNFFSDICKNCEDFSCVKCKLGILFDVIPLDLDGNIPI